MSHPRLLPLHISIASLFTLGAIFPAAAAEISGSGGGKAKGLGGPARVAEPHLATASDEPQKLMKKFQLPPGFQAEVWAAEPMLGNPVSFTIDEQGRIFTAETYRYRTSVLDIRHYMFMLEDDLASRTTDDRIAYTKKNFPNDWQELEKETEVVRVIEDTKGTGKADSSRVYADGFNTMLDGIAAGVLAHDGKVWLTNIPNLWLLSGMKTDGRAEKRESLSFGYGVRYSFTGHDMHGLALGPDGRIYFSFGDRGAYVKTKEGKTLASSDEGGVFRCEQDGSHMEHFYRGLRNPQELAFDNYGNLFTGDNDCDQGDVERWVYVVEGGDSGWRVGWQHPPLTPKHNMWLTEHMWQPRKQGTPFYILSPILNIPDGPSGVAHNPGTGLPPEYDDGFFVCGFKGSTARSAIAWWKVRQEGAGFATENSPSVFVGHVQATDVDFGPDSRMYFTDWGEGWEGTGRGRILRLENPAVRQAQAAQIAEVQQLLKEGFKQRPVTELVKLLGHKDQRIRLNAQWALAAKPDAKPALHAVATAGGERLARLHAMWALGHIARLAGYANHAAEVAIVKPLIAVLNDKDDEVRAQAAKVIGDAHGSELLPTLVAALGDASARVQFFAAQGIAKVDPSAAKTAAEPVLKLLRGNADKDEFVRHACVQALQNMGAETIAAAAKDESPSVRLAALLAMRREMKPEIAQFLADKNPLLVAEALRAINDEGIAPAFDAIAKLIAAPLPDENLMLRVINANFRLGTDAAAQALASYAANEASPEFLRTEALKQLAMWPKPLQRDRIAGVFRPLADRDPAPAVAAITGKFPQLLATKDGAVQLAAIETAATLGAKGAAGELRAAMANQQVPAKARAKALETLASFNDSELAGAIKLAFTDKDPALRIAASAMLGKLNPDEAAKQLDTAFANAGIPEKKAILVALGDLKSAAADTAIAAKLDELKAGHGIPQEVALELLEAAGKRKAPAVKTRLQAYEANLPAADKLAKYSTAMVGGDRDNGEKLFKEHVAAQCFRCHKVHGEGGEAGPDLSDVGTRKDRRYILESIVDPNAQIAEGFQTIMVTLKNGDIQAGIVKAETADELTLLMPVPDAKPVKVKKADIKARENAASGMPPGFGEILSRRELRDLVEYVASLKK